MRQYNRNRHQDSCEIQLAPFNQAIQTSQILTTPLQIEEISQIPSNPSPTTLSYTLTNTTISLETIQKIDKRSQMVNQALDQKDITYSRSRGKLLEKYVFLPKIAGNLEIPVDDSGHQNEAGNVSDMCIQDLIEQAAPCNGNQSLHDDVVQRKSVNKKVFDPLKCIFNVMTKIQIPETNTGSDGNHAFRINGADDEIKQYSMIPLDINEVREYYYGRIKVDQNKSEITKCSSFESSSSTNYSSFDNTHDNNQQSIAIQIQEQKFCRICKLDSESPLIRPCECQDPALQYVHKNCMVAQIYNDAFYMENITNIDKSGPISPDCQICKTEFMYDYEDDEDDEEKQCKCCCKSKRTRSICVILLPFFFSSSLLGFGIALLNGWIFITNDQSKELAKEIFYIAGGIFLLFLLSLFFFCKNLRRREARRRRFMKRVLRKKNLNKEQSGEVKVGCDESTSNHGKDIVVQIDADDDIEQIKAEEEDDGSNQHQVSEINDMWAEVSRYKERQIARRQAWVRNAGRTFSKSTREVEPSSYF